MNFVNRAIAVVKPKQPYVDWTKRIALEPNEPYYETLEEARRDCTAFLFPEVVFDADFARLLRRYASEIFEQQLHDWDERDELWPKQRNDKTLLEWFDIETSSVVIDLDKKPLARKDY